MELKKKKEIDLADAIIRMIQQPGSVTVYQPIENPEDKYTINDLKGLSVNDGAVFMIEDEPEEDPEPTPEEDPKDKWKTIPVVMDPPEEAPKRKGPVIDDGKILALKKAGWSNVKIGEEMGHQRCDRWQPLDEDGVHERMRNMKRQENEMDNVKISIETKGTKTIQISCKSCICIAFDPDDSDGADMLQAMIGVGNKYEMLVKAAESMWKLTDRCIEDETEKIITGGMMVKILQKAILGDSSLETIKVEGAIKQI